MNMIRSILLLLALAVTWPGFSGRVSAAERLRVIIETDAGGDPDDEQSLVRFLLYSNEWVVEGIIATRPVARPKENLNPVRTGLGIVRAQLKAYDACYAKLSQHDRRYPTPEYLWQRTVAGYPASGEADVSQAGVVRAGAQDGDDGVRLIVAAVDAADPRPIWFSNWGTDHGSAESSLKRALDRILRERGPAGYVKFKNRLRLSSADAFGEHTGSLSPPWPIWVDTFRPERDGKRWYHRFSALTATAGGFDVQRDVRNSHGPLGALYPTNTTHWQKEGDTMSFLYLVPTGMNDVLEPAWGSWAGRYDLNESSPGRKYYWANAADAWQGTTHRDNTLRRWAAHLQNDFRARLDWCVKDFEHANHPPAPRVIAPLRRTVRSGEKVFLDARGSTDPDQQQLHFEWVYYPEPGTWRGGVLAIEKANSSQAWFVTPSVERVETLHIILIVTDSGEPPLTRYQRVIVAVNPEPK